MTTAALMRVESAASSPEPAPEFVGVHILYDYTTEVLMSTEVLCSDGPVCACVSTIRRIARRI